MHYENLTHQEIVNAALNSGPDTMSEYSVVGSVHFGLVHRVLDVQCRCVKMARWKKVRFAMMDSGLIDVSGLFDAHCITAQRRLRA